MDMEGGVQGRTSPEEPREYQLIAAQQMSKMSSSENVTETTGPEIFPAKNITIESSSKNEMAVAPMSQAMEGYKAEDDRIGTDLLAEFGAKKKKRNRKKQPFSMTTAGFSNVSGKLTAGVHEEAEDQDAVVTAREKENKKPDLDTRFGGRKKKKRTKSVAMTAQTTGPGCARVTAPEDTSGRVFESESEASCPTRQLGARSKQTKNSAKYNLDKLKKSAGEVPVEGGSDESDDSWHAEDTQEQPEPTLHLDLGKKKKANRKISSLELDDVQEPVANLYSYDELLERLRNQMEAGQITRQERVKTEKVTIPLPQVIKSGRMRTSFVNFVETANRFHRPASHLLAYLNSELGTICTVCSTNQLWIKGNFKVVHIETVLKKYAHAYVVCPACRSGNTLLQKRGRLTFLTCDACDAKFSVANISRGYRARTQIR